jgi:hypothetical protein
VQQEPAQSKLAITTDFWLMEPSPYGPACRVCGCALTAENSWSSQWKHGIYICKACDRAQRRDRRLRNLEASRAREAAYRDSHRDERRAQGATYRERHRDELLEKSRIRYETSREHNAEVRQAWSLALKYEVMSHYADGDPACARCDYSDLRALTIDHINGGGGAHRRQLNGGGWRTYSWLRASHYPVGYQVLCMNCQFIKKLENGEHRWQPPRDDEA